jgi:uncharacterized integral membrane protein (TIGR00698 family)
VVRARADQVAVAVATVVVFGTSAIFLYPYLYHLNLAHRFLPMNAGSYGIFAGSTIHEVAQVVAAGRAVSEGAADTAVITKMVRVMMLAPFLLMLSAYLSQSTPGRPATPSAPGTPAATGPAMRSKFTIPWFALWFMAVAALHSAVHLPANWVSAAARVDTLVLAMAMAALGLTTHRTAIVKAGLKPIALGALLFTWLIVGGAVVNAVIERVL